ncbi:hypothetical protein L6V77_30480 [Myxococcota bacterium]|nr:hypothetical protein [Myxococcota bacterium]
MKTKAYKLAAELGLHEQSVLDWLKSNGYPNVRRADTIRAEVVQAARKALARGAPPPNAASSNLRPSKPPPRGSSAPPAAANPPEDLRVSFAELLEAHLSTASAPTREAEPAPRATGPLSPMPARNTGPLPAAAPLPTDAEIRALRAEEARDAARREADEWRVRFNRARSERDEFAAQVKAWGPQVETRPALEAERARLAQEAALLRQRLKAVDDERATLESTCTDLQEELTELRGGLTALEAVEDDRRQVQEELQAAVQREMAWRARALELERAALLGGSLQAALSRAGVSDVADQAAVLQAVLGHRDGALALLRMLRPTDADGLGRLIAERVRRVCVDAVCNQVAGALDAFVLRVDAERECTVCAGSEERRWFARMALECDRAGVRRLLVIGGPDAVHEQLRGLSQGHRIDFRLVSANDDLFPARVQGRVEGADLVVLWGPGVVEPAVSEPYAQAAAREGRPVAHVVGGRCGVLPMARAVCNRLTRSLVLMTL